LESSHNGDMRTYGAFSCEEANSDGYDLLQNLGWAGQDTMGDR
jgi:hypothetical protein